MASLPLEAALIAGNVRVDQGSSARVVTLRGRSGFSRCRSLQYWLVVVGQSDTITAYMTVQGTIEHGADGAHFVEHTASATMVTVDGGDMTGCLDSTSTKLLGEHVRLKLSSTGVASKWCLVDVYELRREF